MAQHCPFILWKIVAGRMGCFGQRAGGVWLGNQSVGYGDLWSGQNCSRLNKKNCHRDKKTVIVTVIQAYGMKTDTIWDIIFVK